MTIATNGCLNAIARNDSKADIATSLADIYACNSVNNEARGLTVDGDAIDVNRRQRRMNVGGKRQVAGHVEPTRLRVGNHAVRQQV